MSFLLPRCHFLTYHVLKIIWVFTFQKLHKKRGSGTFVLVRDYEISISCNTIPASADAILIVLKPAFK